MSLKWNMANDRRIRSRCGTPRPQPTSRGCVPGRWVHRTIRTRRGPMPGAFARTLGRVGGNRPPARPTACRLPPAAAGRSFRVWWEGIGCGFPLLAPFLIASRTRNLAEPGDRLGLRAGLPRDARSAGRAQPDDRRLRPRRDAVALRRRVAPADGGFDRVGAHDDHRRDAVVEC